MLCLVSPLALAQAIIDPLSPEQIGEAAKKLEEAKTEESKAATPRDEAEPKATAASQKESPRKPDSAKQEPGRGSSNEEARAGSIHPDEPPAKPLSAFEHQLRSYEDPLLKSPVLQFGYDIFERPLQEATDAPVGPGYVLGSGDQLVVSIWGTVAAADQDYRATIERDGQVRLPQIGPVSLGGLSLEAAEAALRREFDKFLKDYKLQVRLGRLRDMHVHVIGRVVSPGRVRVSSVATLFDALSAAGGISKEGSLRGVVLRRQGQPPRVIDLYAYLLEGDLSRDVSLSANDAIVVPAIGTRVAVVGRVLRPAIYEIVGDEVNFDVLLAMAGGYARLADRSSIQVESATSKGLTIRTVDLEKTLPNSVQLHDGDVALVRSASPRLENVVYVAGNVAMPGRYAYREGMRVSDVVTSEALIEAGFWSKRIRPGVAASDVPLPEPFLEYALIRRIERPSLREVRIAFNLGKALNEKDPAENHLLQAQDTVVVFSRSAFEGKQTVFVSGAVHKPGDIPFFPGTRIRDLVRSAGGLRPEALLKSAILTRVYPDQSGTRFENVEVNLAEVMAGVDGANLPLQPGDGLAVKVVPEFHLPFRVEIVGEVRHPGVYTIIPGERISTLLQRVGGFTTDAYLPGAQFYRESVRALQQDRINESLRRLELELKASSQQFVSESVATGNVKTDVTQEQARIERFISAVKATPAKGRLVLRLDAPEALKGTASDMQLAEGDKIVVPRRPQEVHVLGAVVNQTAIVYVEGRTAKDYLNDSGGPSSLADSDMAFIIRADGSADSAQNARRGYRWDAPRARYSQGSLLSSELQPGDALIIPHDVKPQVSTLALTKTVTEILFQTALATGVIIALL